jgi:hypothetical protein
MSTMILSLKKELVAKYRRPLGAGVFLSPPPRSNNSVLFPEEVAELRKQNRPPALTGPVQVTKLEEAPPPPQEKK